MYIARARRKRVVKLPGGGEIDFGEWELRDFIQPRCLASYDIYVRAFARFVSELEERRSLVKLIGLYNVLVKYAWNIVNVEVKYRYDDPVFSVPDFWQLPNETWSMKKGDCEDTTFLLQSVIEAILHAEEVDDAKSYAVIGFYREGDVYYGHGFIIYKTKRITGRWLWIETTLESEVSQNIWYFWNPNKLIPVYFFNSKESYRIDIDYEVLGLTKDYVEAHKKAIQVMIDYVEQGKRMKLKWMHKGKRTPTPTETIRVM